MRTLARATNYDNMKDKRKFPLPRGIKEDHRPPKGAWADGEYLCRCVGCDSLFCGDKRSVQCADCAHEGNLEGRTVQEVIDLCKELDI